MLAYYKYFPLSGEYKDTLLFIASCYSLIWMHYN